MQVKHHALYNSEKFRILILNILKVEKNNRAANTILLISIEVEKFNIR